MRDYCLRTKRGKQKCNRRRMSYEFNLLPLHAPNVPLPQLFYSDYSYNQFSNYTLILCTFSCKTCSKTHTDSKKTQLNQLMLELISHNYHIFKMHFYSLNGLPMSMYISIACTFWCSQGSEKNIGVYRTGVKHHCDLSHECWEQNLIPLQKQ